MRVREGEREASETGMREDEKLVDKGEDKELEVDNLKENNKDR